MVEWKFGDRITWTEGSQMDRMTHQGIVTKVETVLTIVDEDNRQHTLTLDSYEATIEKGWRKKK